MATFPLIHALPDRRPLPVNVVAVTFHPVALPPAAPPLKVAGAWEVTAADRRMGGLSALAIDGRRFLAVSDLGAVVSFDPPATLGPTARIADLADGPGPRGRKVSRDAESLARDPCGRGWWVGYEQRHSLWLYDPAFRTAKVAVRIDRPDWRDNRGIEALVAAGDGLLALAENGREAFRLGSRGLESSAIAGGGDIAEAARAPDGRTWVLLRSKSRKGIEQFVAPLMPTPSGYRVGRQWPLPKAAFDNYEGMVFAARPGGGWRLWLVTDDGHRFMARTLLVALDWPGAGNANARRITPGAGSPSIDSR